MGPKLTLAVAIVPLVLPFIVAYAAMTERGILDPTALFPAFFGAYNGFPLIRFLSDDVRNNLAYPVKFEPGIYFRAGLLSALGAIFIAITWALWRPPAHKKLPKHDVTGWFNTGVICYAIGILLYFLQYQRIGGYWAALAMDRVKRFELMTQTTSSAYYAFVMVGLVMMIASGRSGVRKAAIVVMTALWCVIVMAQGDRRLALQAVMAVTSAATFLMAKSTRIKMTHLLLAITTYVAFSAFGQLREVIPFLVSDAVPHPRPLDFGGTNSLLENSKPENNELAGPFLSVLYNAEHVRDYSLGASYADSIFAVLPRVLYPGSKPLSATAKLDNALHYGGNRFPVAGWGYSPIAEAFLNFGLPGVCLISSLWMGAFVILSRLRNYSWGLVAVAVLSSETVNANRIDFRTVYLESFSCILAVLVAVLLVRSLHPRIHKLIESRRVQ